MHLGRITPTADSDGFLFLCTLAIGWMQDNRDILCAYEDTKETDGSCAVIAAPMPVTPRLQECLAGIEFVERSVGGKLDC